MTTNDFKPRIFKLQMANECLSALPAHLHPQLKQISIQTKITITQYQPPNLTKLMVDFTVNIPLSLQSHIEWRLFDTQKVTRQDFLWESSCLELFIGHTQLTEYVEINASPQGQFAVYHFDDYRYPNQMPPHTLTVNNNPNKYAKIVWVPTIQNHKRSHKRSFAIELNQLPLALQMPNLLNPTLILNINHLGNTVPLYFAHQHASPADFHNQTFWLPV